MAFLWNFIIYCFLCKRFGFPLNLLIAIWICDGFVFVSHAALNSIYIRMKIKSFWAEWKARNNCRFSLSDVHYHQCNGYQTKKKHRNCGDYNKTTMHSVLLTCFTAQHTDGQLFTANLISQEQEIDEVAMHFVWKFTPKSIEYWLRGPNYKAWTSQMQSTFHCKYGKWNNRLRTEIL